MENTIIKDGEIVNLRSDANFLLYKAEEVANVTSTEDEERAVEFLAQVKARARIIDDRRQFFVKPLNDHVKAINAEFKKVSEPLDEAERIVKSGIASHRGSPAFKEAEARRKAIEDEARQAANQGDIAALTELAKEHAQAKSEAPRSVQTSTGKMTTRKAWKFEIEDENLVPRPFLMPDERKITQVVKEGIRIIPGIRIYEDTVISIGS